MNVLEFLYKLFRPKDTIYHLIFFAIPVLFSTVDITKFLLMIPIGLLALFSVFGINQIIDTDVDSLNNLKRRKNPFLSTTLKKIHGYFFVILTILLSTFLAFYIFDPLAALILFLGIFFGIIYSVPPFRFKAKPILDILGHGLFELPFTLFSFYVLSVSYLHLGTSLVISFLLSTLLELFNEIRDFQSDRQAGFKTTALILGKENSGMLFLFLGVVSYLFIFNFINLQSLYYIFLLIGSLHLIILFKRFYIEKNISFTTYDEIPLAVFFILMLLMNVR